jgi:chromate reductase, NAD(P)H dehydrogenase (quinone)
MPQPRILALSGSARKASFNERLINLAAQATREAGAEVTVVDWREFPLPLYDGDTEAEHGLPEAAVRLKQLFIQHQGLLIAAPEYNSSITPLLKNAIDWVSRSVPGEASLAAYTGKVATLLSASPGALGGLRGLVHLRSILGNIGVIVLPGQLSVSKANEAFHDDGTLRDAVQHARLSQLASGLVAMVRKVNAS